MSLRVLGIETSCDETAASIVQYDPKSGERKILSNIILSQIAEHKPFGGVVPELAARSHITSLDAIIQEALEIANIRLDQLDGIAATAGPGLIGGVMVGMVTGKSLSFATGLPFLGINHLEGHALTIRLSEHLPFPYLLLLVSGGHCQILSIEDLGHYICYGQTLDDAVGEAFDKTSKLMGLGYPGGPIIEQYAQIGDPNSIPLPRPLHKDGSCNFSFSGLKTALRTKAKKLEPLSQTDIVNLSASFQLAITDCLQERCLNALSRYKEAHYDSPLRFVIAGGVASNQYIRKNLKDTVTPEGFSFHVAPVKLCTDNAAMIAWAGIERLQKGQNDSLALAPRARWALETMISL